MPDCSVSSHIKFSCYTKEELILHAKSQHAEIKKIKKQVDRLQEYKKNMTNVGSKTNTDLTFIMDNLHKGLTARNKKFENPVCKWEDCCQHFCQVEDLFTHIVKQHIPDTEVDKCPIDRSYVCKWKKCTKKFKSIKLLKNHIIEHSGDSADAFLTVLLKDQAKALTTPSRSMRWHPLVIKWCLRTWRSLILFIIK